MVNWKPIKDIPKSGKFIIATKAPTNWTYWVNTIILYDSSGMEKVNKDRLKYAYAWDYCPKEPNKFIEELYYKED